MSAPPVSQPSLKVGQTLVLARRKRHGDCGWLFDDIVITKVGRKWAYFGNDRKFLIASMTVEGYGNGGIYPDREAFDVEQTREDKWGKLRKAVERTYLPPSHITTAMIEQAAATLGIGL